MGHYYAFDNGCVCRNAFCNFHDISVKKLKNLKAHLQKNGFSAVVHGNRGRRSHHGYSFEVIKNVVSFIKNFSEIHGLSQPSPLRGRSNNPPVYLPAFWTKVAIHKRYCDSCLAGEPRVGLTVFKTLWLKACPDLVIMTPRTDVCHTCEKLRCTVMRSVTEEEKIEATEEFQKHLHISQEHRTFYSSAIKRSHEVLKYYSQEECCPNTPVYPCSKDITLHYTFDFAQQLQLPYHSKQVGPLYLKKNERLSCLVCVVMESRFK